MNAYDRLARIRECIRLRGWNKNNDQDVSLVLNESSWPDRSEPSYGGRRFSIQAGDRQLTGKWVSAYAGLRGEGETPEDAAEELERVVFAALLRNLDGDISQSIEVTSNLQQLRERLSVAMGLESSAEQTPAEQGKGNG